MGWLEATIRTSTFTLRLYKLACTLSQKILLNSQPLRPVISKFATSVTERNEALAERDALQHEPARCWMFLTKPFFVALVIIGVGDNPQVDDLPLF